MFERYLAEALASRVGHIVSNFDSKKVKISVWNGEVVLKDLTLKQDALQKLSVAPASRTRQSNSFPDKTKETEYDIPFTISHGHIGTFELHIPWQILRRSKKKLSGGIEGSDESHDSTSSCSLVLSDVDILISPGIPRRKIQDNNVEGVTNSDHREAEKGSEQERIEKEHLVQNILDGVLFRKNIEHAADLYATNGEDPDSRDSDKETKDKSFVKNLVENILSSLEVTVRNIHIRYEDPGDCLGFETRKKRVQHRPPFAIGITLEEFKLGGTECGPKSDNELYQIPAVDSKNQRDSGTKSPNMTHIHEGLYSIQHKLAAAKNLSVYWDSDISMKDLIHVTVPRLERRRRRRESYNLDLRAGSDDGISLDDELSSDDEFEDCASDMVGGIPDTPRSRESSHHETLPENCSIESESDVDHDSRHDMFSMLLGYALKSKDRQRTYIIQPISPSLHCTIVNSLDPIASEGDKPAPPSRAVLTLPASKSNITKDTLEDIAYLRRSLAHWNEMRQNLLTRQIYESLARARPKVSPKENPRAWWHYAFEAVKILSLIQHENKKVYASCSKKKKRKGWLGLSESIQLRKRYIALYRELLNTENSDEREKRELNSKLCSMEDTLEPDEIAAFRLKVISINLLSRQHMDRTLNNCTQDSGTKASIWEGWLWRDKGELDSNEQDTSHQRQVQDVLFEQGSMLTWKYREIVYSEMMVAMEGEYDVSYDALFSRKSDRQLASASLMLFKGNTDTGSKLEMAIICQEIVLQVDDIVARQDRRGSRQRRPILQLCCANVQKICFRHKSDWDITSTFASLELLDLMENTFGATDCPRLITRKRSWVGKKSSVCDDDISEKSVRIGDKTHFHGGTIFVKKSCIEVDACDEYGEQEPSVMTTINVELSPMEIVYSPESLQAISKVFSTTKTSELSVDYQRFKLMVSNWRAQQKRRLIAVLSQREKHVEINVDISAPKFLMHDKTSNGTLVLDLGRLSFQNGKKSSAIKQSQEFDDVWDLSLQNIQVLCMPSPNEVSPSTYKLVHYENIRHLVEPFSLDFIMYTKFGNGDEGKVDHTINRILIDATLPRLVFNMNSSSVRLVHRISEYRTLRKTTPRTNDSVLEKDKKMSRTPSSSWMQTSDVTEPAKKSYVDISFSAPLVVLRLTNDVDGRDSLEGRDQKQTHIAALVVKGIGGDISRVIAGGADEGTTFSARLNSLYAKDLYQRAGRSFSLLLSSKETETGEIPMELSVCDPSSEGNENAIGQGSDLVRVRYTDNGNNHSHQREKELSIEFNELYVGWNPETIAAIQKALRLSSEENNFFTELRKKPTLFFPHNPVNEQALMPWHLNRTSSLDESVAFFDAMEEQSMESYSSKEDQFLSEASSEDENAESFLLGKEILSNESLTKAMSVIAMNDLCLDHSESEESNDDTNPRQPTPTLFVSFHLSKLRVSFNKESRLRRLITAEMNETLIQFKTKPFGGRKVEMRVGNLTLSDPSHLDGSTLYNEILGLKTDTNDNCSESMLQITHETFPRDEYNTLYESAQSDPCNSDVDDRGYPNLRIYREDRKISGCDSFLTMHFSPMRFVFLQQLWLEIVDYFFEGIIGCEVWGRVRPWKDDAVDEAQKKIVKEIRDHGYDPPLDSRLPWADANGVKFLKISITLEAPIIILPVEYRSPQHLRFSVDRIVVKNRFHGQKETLSCSDVGSSPYVQWYNNYDIDFEGLHLSSWCGTQLNIQEDPKIVDVRKGVRTSIPMKMQVKWPVGPTAFTIVPKWNFRCSIERIRLLFRRNDVALFQHIISKNIGEVSRHLDEWNALQNLPPGELVAYKKKIMVHFGYDKKDAPPTTFHFNVDMSSIIIHFCLDENSHVADLEGSKLHWSLRKVKDRISRQLLTFNSIHLTQTSGRKEWARCKTLLFPLNVSEEEGKNPQLVYRSTSKLNGDNVRFLSVSNACIYLIYPAWMFVKSFFSNLPDPDVMHNAEVLSSVQINDRWYRVEKNLLNENHKTNNIDVIEKKIERVHPNNSSKSKASYQFRLLLECPRIVLVDDPALNSMVSVTKGRAVTLALGHLDFLHRNNPMEETIKKTVFIHDLELFTGFTDEVTSKMDHVEANSLLYPLSIGIGNTVEYDGEDIIATNKWISSDVISARAAYSDITLATDVFLKTLLDYRQVQADHSKPSPASPSGASTTPLRDNRGVRESMGFACGGFDLLVIDDSGRHFLTAQELVQVSISGILYKRSNTDTSETTSTMRLQLNSVQLIDCLQPKHSPFRVVAIGKHFEGNENSMSGDMVLDQKSRWLSMNNTVFEDFMSWENHANIENSIWGYSPSPSMRKRFETAYISRMRPPFDKSNLINLDHRSYSDGRDEYSCDARSVVLQWNPSMAIALQRFLGRLRKQAKEKYLVEHMSDQNGAQVDSSSSCNEDVGKRNTKIQIEFQSLTLCLNKEHQHRRLLQITMTKSYVCFQRDQYSRLNVYGHIGDFNAWDSDGNREGQVSICRENRLVIGVLHNPADDEYAACPEDDHCSSPSRTSFHRLLSFNFYSQPKETLDFVVDKEPELELPEWVRVQVGEDASVETIDDCLSLSIATVRFNHITDRTGELIDYLSNGLPGKGMGATSRAAKGFISKRIKTRSFTNLSINSPQLLLPRNRGVEDGIIICLGDVKLKSWFDEATLEDSTAINCDDLTLTQIPMYQQVPVTPQVKKESNKKYWWRVHSLSILGLGWRVNREKEDTMSSSLTIENPVNIYLQARKPPVHSDQVLPMIVRCRLTSMELVLSYSDYILLNAVLKENLMKKVDKSLWDRKEEVKLIDHSVEEYGSGVQYSKNARFVRYGEQSKRHSDEGTINTGDTESVSSMSVTSMDVKLSLDGLALTLSRDDLTSDMPNDFIYDIVSLDINDVIFSMSANTDDSKSATVEFNSVSLYDVGDTGRLAREQFQIQQALDQNEASERPATRRPSVFHVIAEGYDAPIGSYGLDAETSRDPLLIIAVDTKSSASFGLESLMDIDCDNAQVTSVRVTLNKMNINPLIRPLGEITDFFSCAWTARDEEDNDVSEEHVDDHQSTNSSIAVPSELPPSRSKSLVDDQRIIRAFHLTVVTNYPRIFLVPDETDISTRALVLRGLTVLNATLVKEMGAERVDRSRILSIEGHLRSLESYINPDPRTMLEQRSLWQRSIDDIILKDSYLEKPNDRLHDSLGVALIEPVTAAFNFRQIRRHNFPTVREAFLSMEPVSTTFSFEDIQLIEVVLKRWKSERELKIARKNRSSAPSDSTVPETKKNSQDMEPLSSPSQPNFFDDTFDESEELLGSDSMEAQTNTSMCGSCISTDSILSCLPGSPVSLCSQGQTKQKSPTSLFGESKSRGDEYSVLFKRQKLGLVLKRSGVTVTVDKVLDIDHSNKIYPGDQVVSIGARAIVGMSFQSVLAYLKKAERPLLIYFRPKHSEKLRLRSIEEYRTNQNADNQVEEIPAEQENIPLSLSTDTNVGTESETNVQSTSLQMHKTTKVLFRKGANNGLEIEKCLCGDIAVITRVCETSYRHSCVESSWKGYIPQPGTAIVAVDQEPAVSIGYQGTAQFLQSFTTTSECVDEEYGYTLTFLDASADDWGGVDTVEIVVAGIKLTLIDDINGRDMPLLRGCLESIALRLERGLGLDCNSIQVGPPSILLTSKTNICDTENEHIVTSDLTEVITKIYGNAETRLDYYNARIAVWEPFLEPSYLSVETEYQKGNESMLIARPGSLSIALSDYQALLDSSAVKQSFVCLNLTDAAADLLITAYYEWKIWRKSLKSELGDSKEGNSAIQGSSLQSPKSQNTSASYTQLALPDFGEVHTPNPSLSSSIEASHLEENIPQHSQTNQGAVQNAAQAALIFARRRGAECEKYGGSKPFVFRNRTGMQVSFVSEALSNFDVSDGESPKQKDDLDFSLGNYKVSCITSVKDGEEALFSLDNDELESSKGSNKVRSYDGEFPLLSVGFHSPVDNVQVEVLQHMSVVKIGETMKRLVVNKISPGEEKEIASTLVVWSVALDNNRRIITLSSGVRVASQDCGIPVEVGLRYTSEQDEKDENIQLIGRSSSTNSCFLPMWVELRFLPAEIYIRPFSRLRSYKWSKQNVMNLKRTEKIGPDITQRWTWEMADSAKTIQCDLTAQTDLSIFPAWLSYRCNHFSAKLFNDTSRDIQTSERDEDECIKQIDICSNICIRNALPVGLEWEVMEETPGNDTPYCILDGSTLRERHGYSSQIFNEGKLSSLRLKSGHGTDVLSCDMSMQLNIRIRCDDQSEWSKWVTINPPLKEAPLDTSTQGDKKGGSPDSVFESRSTHVQSHSKAGTPLTLGLKINPRVATIRQVERPSKMIVGYEVIAYSEIWIKNLTSLPISFGVPSNQVTSPPLEGGFSSRIAAEAALSELSSILEFGDKGHGLTKTDDEGRDILLLPLQQCDILVEEVFEYVEVEKGEIKKRWWAGEHHVSKMPDLVCLNSLGGAHWRWKDETWNIDTSGGCKSTHGGWESCISLVGGKTRNFTASRNFNQSHRFRRRRWFRRKVKGETLSDIQSKKLDFEISSFHHSILDVTSRMKAKRDPSTKKKFEKDNGKGFLDVLPESDEEETLKVCFKVDDSAWSTPAVIPYNGTTHGVLRIPASRWPAMSHSRTTNHRYKSTVTGNSQSTAIEGISKVAFKNGCLSPRCFDISYQVSSIEGRWGEHSRLLLLFPRYFVRNESKEWQMEIKQVGASDSTAVSLNPGSSRPFHWTDVRLPELICVRPVTKYSHNGENPISWSGGFDITCLGMIPLRIRENADASSNLKFVNVVRALVELRSGTGGTGITVSLKDELNNGEDSLYRIENQTPFPLWITQDGLLLNPHQGEGKSEVLSGQNVILPMSQMSYGLDVPFRQGKYSGRKPVSFEELMRLRVGLAPLSSRDGIESTKVVGLSRVEANIRLKPAKLRSFFDDDTIADLMCLNVQGVVSADGPTRVLKFTLIQRELTASSVIKNSVRLHTSGSSDKKQHSKRLHEMLKIAADKSLALLRSNVLPRYNPRVTNLSKSIQSLVSLRANGQKVKDCNYSFRASFSGFVFSLIDKVPSEIAVISLRKVDAMAEWNALKNTESSGAISIGWMQLDNHCPNAPFPVALCQSLNRDDIDDDGNEIERPFLTIGVVRAPRHKSNTTCLDGVTIAPSDISLATDLALLVRIQYYLLSILSYLERSKVNKENDLGLGKEIWSFPDFEKLFTLRTSSTGGNISSKNMYFGGLTFMPFTLKLSVAPAVALTSAQAALEGPEAGAIHAAVRKGDLLIGSQADGVLGVKIGSKNRTALAVIRGIFKSILVDSLLRCNDVSMNFSGLALRNHLSTIPQLKTFIFHHYLSLLKSNMPALLGSLAAFGNPVGLIRGFGDGVTDFVSEPVKGFKRSVQELDPTYVMDGVARGTGSLARHTVGGIVDSASLLTETFSKNMAVLTLDRKYAQRRDRFKAMPGTNATFVGGVESGMGKFLRGVAEGVIGVVRAPMRGAEKRGVEGFAKGVGKGLLGLVVKPVIGISDAATDVMVGVKGSLEAGNNSQRGRSSLNNQSQIRPRRAFYGRDRRLRPYVFVDAISAAIMMRTKLAGENYLSHVDMGGRVAILSVRRFLLLGDDGETQLLIKLKNIKRVTLRQIDNNGMEWGVLIFLKTSRKNGNQVEVITSEDIEIAKELESKIKQGAALCGAE